MTKERLIIKNFGPIKEVDLELGKMNILIGEQATGKSTIAKVLSICRYFSYITDFKSYSYFYNNTEFGATENVNNALTDWGLEEFLVKETFVSYENNDYKVNLELEECLPEDIDSFTQGFCFNIKKFNSRHFEKLISDSKEIYSEIYAVSNNREFKFPTSFLLNEVKKTMNNPFFFPTERGLQSIFSLGRTSLNNLSDSLFNQLSLFDKVSNELNSLNFKHFNLSVKNRNGTSFIRNEKSSKYTKLSNSASGYKSMIPILSSIEYYNNLKKRDRTFIVEEPEQNLFPKTQKKLMEFFVESINKHNNQILLPTHSPYILTSLENMMYAYKLGNMQKGKYNDEVEKIVEKKYWMKPEDVSAYYLEDGKAIDILDKTEAALDKEYLDSVSDIIIDEYDRLLAIEVENNIES